MLRLAAGWIRPVGEYVALSHVFLAALVALAPICLPSGLIFPMGCEALARRRGQGVVSRIYAVEALGGFAAGVAFSFYWIDHFSVIQITGFAMTASLAGAVWTAPSGRGARLAGAAAVLVILASVCPGVLRGLEWRTVEWRWAGLGVTHDGAAGRHAVTLKGGFDTRYQNLALVESEGLFSIYGDGQVMCSFPDEITSERAVGFVMAQNPRARRVLLLGGNPAGELPYLLNTDVEEVVWVERDPAVERLVRAGTPGIMEKLDKDPRLNKVCDDGPRFVKRCRSTFDVVLIHVPEPVSGSLNRFYTREFYEDVRGILSPGGFMHTSVEASELLEKEAARMAGSVDRTLRTVFPVVKVTAGPPVQFFASGAGGSLSLDRDVLYRRSLSASTRFQSFKPVYFLDADELDPEKIAFVEQRLMSAGAPVNSIMSPAAWRYTLVLWGRYSDSWIGLLLGRMELIQPGWVAGIFAGLGGVAGVGLILARRRRRDGVIRMMACQVVAATGFCGVALELILLYAFQGLHGYVYGRMSFMVGLFMLGTVAGAGSVRHVEQGGLRAVRVAIASGLAVMAVMAFAVWWSLMHGVHSDACLFGLMAAVGSVVGIEFVAASRLLVVMGVAENTAAGRAWFWDYWGSAAGGLVAGVFLPAVYGIAATCLVISVGLTVSLILFMTSGFNLKSQI